MIRDGEIVASGTEKQLSEQLLAGMRLSVLLRVGADAVARAVDVLGSVPGVTEVELDDTAPGPEQAQFRVRLAKDSRAELARAVVESGFGLLEVTRGERELESVILARPAPSRCSTPRRSATRRSWPGSSSRPSPCSR